MTESLIHFPGLIIVLGSSNTKQGVLSPIAKSRAAKAYDFWLDHPTFAFLLTGGFGSHFNQTDKPHADYVKDYLISLGLPSSSILGIVESFNTIEDAFLSFMALDGITIDHLVVSTSDFHVRRAQLIFENIFAEKRMTFLSSTPPVSVTQKKKLEEHESISIRRLLKANRLQVFNYLSPKNFLGNL